MEDLNKNQIVLLTLLVSFVTSIATGIMTVSLLQQAPLEVTRNINRIVERTVETVTPSSVLSAINTKDKQVTTIVINEDDSVTNSINKNVRSIVRIIEEDEGLHASFYGIGVVINKDGTIAADRKTIASANIYTATMSDGQKFKLVPMGVDKKTNFILFRANLPIGVMYTFVSAALTDTEPKLGQTLVSLGGEATNAVSVGRITLLQMRESESTTTPKVLSGIVTDVSANDLVNGSPVLNLSGEVVGMKLGNDWPKTFTPISVLKKELPVLTEVPKTETKTQ